tara:strand:- start:62 stop:421 length:360 start_codon:yes stop_codon:yes gene_type:complete
MAKKIKNIEVTIVDKGGSFNTFFKKFTGDSANYDLEGLSTIRKLLSNERAKILHSIKVKKPGSIYQLAKFLGRDFKSVSEDVKLLERFDLIEMVSEKTGNRERLKPIITTDTINISLKI